MSEKLFNRSALFLFSQCVDHIFDALGLIFGLFDVERLPRDGLAEDEVDVLALLLIHLVGQIEHLDVELEADGFAEAREVVEEVAVAAGDVDGYYVALGLDGFGYEGLFPLKVNYPALLFARAEAGGEHEHLVVALEGLVHKEGGLATRDARLVDRQEDVREVLEEEEHVVDGELHVLELLADGGYEGHAIESAHGVVGGEDEAAVGGDVVEAVDVHRGLELLDDVISEVYAMSVSLQDDEVVYVVLMDGALEVVDNEVRHFDSLGLGGNYFVDVYG